VKKNNVQEVKTECNSCSGTGLYCGMCEPVGTAVICINCGGTGCATLRYVPFEERHEKRGVKTVSISRGSFIGTGVGAHGNSISYEEFKNGKMPGQK
jgi:hypothetical protein